MNSFWLVLVDAKLGDVEVVLRQHGCDEVEGAQWNYPSGPDAALYMSVTSWAERLTRGDEDQSAEDDLHAALGEAVPSVHLLADVSGRHLGGPEVPFLLHIMLTRFEGYAFDDWFGYAHAWTLDEIETGKLVDGLGFFDYQGWYEKSKARRDEADADLARNRAEIDQRFGSASDDATLSRMVAAGYKLEAVVRLRSRTGWGLKEAVDYIESLRPAR